MFANTKMVNQQVHNPHKLFVNSIRCIVRQQCLTACVWTSRRRPTRFSPMLTFLGGTGRPDFFHLHGLLFFDERVVIVIGCHSFISFISRVFFPTFLHSIYKFYHISISYTKWCLFTSLPTSHIRKLTAANRFVLQLGRLGICESSLRKYAPPKQKHKKLTWAVKMMGFQEESPFEGVCIFRCHVLFVWGVIRASVMKPNLLGLISPLCDTISLFLRQIVVIILLLKYEISIQYLKCCIPKIAPGN